VSSFSCPAWSAIDWSDAPWSAAVVMKPDRRLWPANTEGSRPAALARALMMSATWLVDRRPGSVRDPRTPRKTGPAGRSPGVERRHDLEALAVRDRLHLAGARLVGLRPTQRQHDSLRVAGDVLEVEKKPAIATSLGCRLAAASRETACRPSKRSNFLIVLFSRSLEIRIHSPECEPPFAECLIFTLVGNSQWWHSRFGNQGMRGRKVGIVALARKLAIALWRFVEDGIVPEGAALKVRHTS
jgi:hypothetical protein